MKKKKVLILLNNIPLYGSERGNINVFYALKEDVDSLFATHSLHGDLYVNPYLEKLGLKHTPALYIGKICRRERLIEYFIELKNSIKGNIDLWRIINKYKPDFIHVPTETSFLSMFMVLYFTSIPVVFRLGDKPRSNRKLFTFIWKKIIIPKVSKFVTISEFIKNQLLKLNVPGEKIIQIYNSPPVRLMHKESMNYVNGHSKGFNVCYMGQITKDKGVDLLVDAAVTLCREYNNINFFIAGDYEWQNPFAKDLIKKVKELNLNDRIKFLGMVEDIQSLLQQSDVHVCPSVWDEPLSNVTVEAKAAGKPSIIFSSGGLPELIEHKIDGYICNDKNSDSIVDAIKYYYHNPIELEKAGIAATESMNKLEITPETFKDKWLKIYAD